MRMLINTEAELKKSVAHKKACNNFPGGNFPGETIFWGAFSLGAVFREASFRGAIFRVVFFLESIKKRVASKFTN